MTNKIKSPKPQRRDWSLSHWAFIGNWDLGIGHFIETGLDVSRVNKIEYRSRKKT